MKICICQNGKVIFEVDTLRILRVYLSEKSAFVKGQRFYTQVETQNNPGVLQGELTDIVVVGQGSDREFT